MTQPALTVVPENQLVGTDVTADVLELWEAVFQCSEIVIQHSKEFGFTGMTKPNPNIKQLLMYVALVEGAIDMLVDAPDAVSIEEMRLLLNAQKQFATLKMIAKIVDSKEGTHEQFQEAMLALKKQATF